MFRFTLPKVPGKYPVGTTTFAVPVTDIANDARIVGNARLRSTSDPDSPSTTPALKLEEVAFTAFYPADVSSLETDPHIAKWVPRPVDGVLQGYAHFGRLNVFLRLLIYIFGFFARLLKFTAYTNAKLLDPRHADGKGKPWPLIIFSHGLAGTRTSYTHLCSRLASEGKVVLALEHRDGTGPLVMTRSPIPGIEEKPDAQVKYYLNPDDIEIGAERSQDRFAFTVEQLNFRRLEIYLAYTAFTQLANSKYDTAQDQPDPNRMHTVDGPWNFKLEERERDRLFWKSWEFDQGSPKVQCDTDVCLAGHSFGAATLLSLLTCPPPVLDGHQFPPLPVSQAIALDPWVDPLPTPVPDPQAVESSLDSRSGPPPKLLVINSEDFTIWKEHFPRLVDIVKLWNRGCNGATENLRARLVTIVRSKHISFSDFGVFFAFGREGREGLKYLDTIFSLSSGLLRTDLQAALQKETRASGNLETYRKGDGSSGRKFVGKPGDIVVHI